MHKEISIIKNGRMWFSYGFSFRRFAIGASISWHSFDLDLTFFWIGLEW